MKSDIFSKLFAKFVTIINVNEFISCYSYKKSLINQIMPKYLEMSPLKHMYFQEYFKSKFSKIFQITVTVFKI